jgi:hypothetical protein
MRRPEDNQPPLFQHTLGTQKLIFPFDFLTLAGVSFAGQFTTSAKKKPVTAIMALPPVDGERRRDSAGQWIPIRAGKAIVISRRMEARKARRNNSELTESFWPVGTDRGGQERLSSDSRADATNSRVSKQAGLRALYAIWWLPNLENGVCLTI